MTDKTALVVGASRGIGLGLAKELVGRGWKVIATRRSAASDKGLQAFADQSGGQLRVETLDLEDSAGIDAFAGKLGGEGLDLLMINAGISGPDTAATATPEGVATLFLTNSVAPIHLAQALLPQLRDGQSS